MGEELPNFDEFAEILGCEKIERTEEKKTKERVSIPLYRLDMVDGDFMAAE